MIVFAARRRGGAESWLFLREVDQLEATRLPGTEGGTSPFFSPDGDWIGFFAGGELKKAPLTGAAPAP